MERLSALYVDVGDQQSWLLPANIVAEILSYAELVKMRDGKTYLKWRDRYLKTLSITSTSSSHGNDQHTYFLVVKTLGATEQYFWGLKIHSLPEWLSVSERVLSAINVSDCQKQAHHKMWLNIHDQKGIIPDFDFIEKSILKVF